MKLYGCRIGFYVRSSREEPHTASVEVQRHEMARYNLAQGRALAPENMFYNVSNSHSSLPEEP